MTLVKRGSYGLTRTRSLLNTLIELPDLARTIQALPAQIFASLVRKVGVEDAGELIALATTEQLVQAFDEDLFVSARVGARESLDVGRFVVWLEVLLEAGDEVAADRVAELDEDFVAHALGGVVLVIEEDALRNRLDAGDEDEARQVDKSLESALTEDIDGYILVAKQHDGWDAVLALVLALDRNHRASLVRLLDRLARVGSRYLDDIDELSTVLSEGESLAEDVEAAREERRSKQGYVEARAARAFLSLARKPPVGEDRPTDRDPLTRAYFREVERSRSDAVLDPAAQEALHALPPAVLRELDEVGSDGGRPALPGLSAKPTTIDAFTEALRNLNQDEPILFGERMEEFAYLANVLVAGHDRNGSRLRPEEAVDSVIAMVCFGAVLEVRARKSNAKGKAPPTSAAFTEILRQRGVDLLFRVASSALAAGAAPKVKSAKKTGLLYSAEELEAAIR
ncbi:MAG: DUF6178 family protein [Polyangiaceae bacterium]|nr:DUF6178 family protein [Polyangiaceae bacterium]